MGKHSGDKKVCPELLLLDNRGKVTIGGRNHPCICAQGASAPKPFELALL